LIANSCIKRGLAGIVIDGGVRDTGAIRNLHFPVWAKYISVAGTSKSRPGWVNVPIEFGGVNVSPGDFVAADDDGIVIVPRRCVKEVMSAAEKRLEKEKKTKSKIADGELSVDFYGLKTVISDLNIEYVEKGYSAEDVHIVDNSRKMGG
jgi:4-hydroxy-4-methyl-2-oxoglutarate aldolase